MVLELVPGGSLQDITDAVPGHVLSDALACRFTRQLLQGLEYCHSKVSVQTAGTGPACDDGPPRAAGRFPPRRQATSTPSHDASS